MSITELHGLQGRHPFLFQETRVIEHATCWTTHILKKHSAETGKTRLTHICLPCLLMLVDVLETSVVCLFSAAHSQCFFLILYGIHFICISNNRCEMIKFLVSFTRQEKFNHTANVKRRKIVTKHSIDRTRMIHFT